MKGIVVYYSATGNNKKIARAIHRGMKSVIDADIAMDKEIDPKDIGKYDLIGIGSPIWFQRETANTRLFIYKMPDMTGKLAFVFSVHGVTSAHIFWSMIPPIQRKGLTIIGWNDWFGTYYTSLHRNLPGPIDGHPDDFDLKEAEDFGREMAEHAQRIYAGEKELIPEIPKGPNAPRLFQPHGVIGFFPGAEFPQRSVNMEKCIYPECTQCIDNCVVNAIDFSKNPPAFTQKTCLNCCLCDRMCPQGAIEIPEEQIRQIRTVKRINMDKCKYPECTVCVDYCMMNAIDFSETPPVLKRSCEGDDLCWVICPHDAIEITNLDITHRKMWQAGQARKGDPREIAVNEREADGRFIRYIPKEKVGSEGPVMDIKRVPRFDIHELMKDDD